jgi:hypothetical protein
MNKCLNCGKEVKNKYCNSKCRNKHNPTKYIPTLESIEKQKITVLNKWKIFKVKCFTCKSEFEISEYNVNIPKKEKYFCSRSCANTRKHSEETKLKIGFINKKNYLLHDKNKRRVQKNLNKRILKTCPICKNDFWVRESGNNRIYCSKKCYCNDKNCKYRGVSKGGYRKGSGRGKSGWYKGYWCDSSYELAFVIYNIDHKIIFERNNNGFEYYIDNIKHKYYPDFIIDNVYYEIKGYERKKDILKYNSFKKPLIVMKKNELKHIFSYIIEKYGKNYIHLYDDNPYNKLTNFCKVCGKQCKSKNIYCSRQCAGKGNNRNSVWK